MTPRIKLFWAFLVTLAFLAWAHPVRAEAELPILASSAVLVDGRDGSVLWEKDSHQRRAIASTTKIVTAMVVIDRAGPDDTVVASSRAEEVGATDSTVSEIELRTGETLTVEQLLFALLLESANDAAVALAEHVAGHEGAFVTLMNETARRLGAVDTTFTNPHGLDEDGHYSSAHDLALLARHAMTMPRFRALVASARHEIPGPGGVRVLMNRNELLGTFEGANGIKTGRTNRAGPSLVASSRRGEEERITVVLNAPDPVHDAGVLLQHGFSGFRRFNLSSPWGYVTYGDGRTQRIVPTSDLSLLVPTDAADPVVTFDAGQLRLGVRAGSQGERSVPVKLECVSESCEERTTSILNEFVETVWRVLSPVARVLSNL